MVVGLLSDTHGSTRLTGIAVRRLLEAGAEHLLHCGDIGTTGILDLLAGASTDAVLGNCDYDACELLEHGKWVGVSIHVPFAELMLADVSVAVIHGDDEVALQRLLRSGRYQYVFSGHTHVAHDRKVGRTRWINPGAIHRASRPTVATLDLSSGTLSSLRLT
jgi:putative phosphoesterase